MMNSNSSSMSMMSTKTMLTIFVTLFLISLFLYFLIRWNKCTESFAIPLTRSIIQQSKASVDVNTITKNKM